MQARASKKVISLLLTLAMLCGLLCTTALAEESTTAATTITTVSQLAAMTSGDYVLGGNIEIDATTWTPITNFTGTFDGAKASGYKITWSGSVVGSSNFAIFGTNSGTVQNLKVEGTLTVTGSNLDYISPVVGYNNGTINGVESTVTLDASGHYNVGGIAGLNDGGYILNSINGGAVTGYSKTGGIVGTNYGTVNSCSNTAQIKGTYNSKSGIGGIAGHNGDKATSLTGHIWNCWNSGFIVSGTPGQTSTEGSWVGGICGFLNGLSDCVNCYNTGDVSGHAYLDHISGNTEGINTNCYGLITATGPQGYDKAQIVDANELKGLTPIPDKGSRYILDLLNIGTEIRWKQTTGNAPALKYNATVGDVNPSEAITFTHTMPTTVNYTVGDYFDPAGLEVTATYSDGTTKTVASDYYSFTPDLLTHLTLDDTCVEVNGRYDNQDFSFTIPITVDPIGVTIKLVSGPDKTVYDAGEAFDATGIRIVAYITGGSEEEITVYNISKTGPLTPNDTVITLSGTYSTVPFEFGVDITVNQVESVTLGGSGTFSSLTDALDSVVPNGTVSVLGTVSITEAMSRNDVVTISRGAGFDGTMFVVNVTDTDDNIVTLTSMTIEGGTTPSGETLTNDTLFEVQNGVLRLRGNVKLQNCLTAVDVKAGGAVTVNKADINASRYSIALADSTSAFTLQNYGGTAINGKVYLGNGAYITVAKPVEGNDAIPEGLAVECASATTGQQIAVGSGYTLTNTDASHVRCTIQTYRAAVDLSSTEVNRLVLVPAAVYLKGTATTNGNGTLDHPFNILSDALAAAGASTETIYVNGTVSISEDTTIDSNVSFQGGSALTDPMFSVTDGTLVLAGGVELTNCVIAVDVAGGALTVHDAVISANQYSIKLAGSTSAFTLENTGATSITGTVYLGSGAYITVGAAIPCDLDVESVDTDPGTWIAVGSGYTLDNDDLLFIICGEPLALDTLNNRIVIDE